jgi:hypothetical protein
MTTKILFICKNILNIFYLYLYPSKNINNIPNIKIQIILQNNNKNLYFYQPTTNKLSINNSEIITNTNIELFWPSTEIIIPIIISTLFVIGLIAYIIYSENIPNPTESSEYIIPQNIKQINTEIIENVMTEIDDILTTANISIIKPFNNSINDINIILIDEENNILDYNILYDFISEDYIQNILIFFPY